MQISKISKQKKRNDRYNVYVDDKFMFSLSANDLLKAKIAKGDQASSKDIENFKRMSAKSLLMDHAIAYQASRPHSIFETKTYLKRKIIKNPEIRIIPRKVQDLLILEIVESLISRAFISDEDFAIWLIKQRTESRNPKSKRAISSELREKRVPFEIITKALSNFHEEQDLENAVKIAQKKSRVLEKYTNKQRREKLIVYLKNRGYGWITIKQVVDTIYSQN